jgi:hypothetical protein
LPYQPTGPYIFQSGKHVGQSAELLMFDDYGTLRWMLSKMESAGGRQNVLHQHLAWLMQRGENRQTKMICPRCGTRPVQLFSVRYSYGGRDFSIGSTYTCCKMEVCRQALYSMSAENLPTFMSFRFSRLMNFGLRSDRLRVAEIFKEAFDLPKPLTRDAVFQFFNQG